jgi:hypothetical protein
MLRRDELIKKLGSLNSGSYLNTKLEELESYVDSQLSNDELIIKMVNLNTQGVMSTSGIETVSTFEPTFAVHNDINVKVGVDGTSGSGKRVWNESLQYQSGAIATQTPWTDLVIDHGTFNGYIKIELPENTNKNVAYLLAQKYQSTDLNGVLPYGGFWGSNNVFITYDTNLNKLYITFKLF